MMDLERADTFTEYRDMSDIANPPSNGRSFRVINFSFGQASPSTISKPKDFQHNDIYGDATSFKNVSNRPTWRAALFNRQTEQDELMDEETWHWPTLLARIFAFFLLFVTILCLCLQAISKRFLILAAIVCVLLIVVIVGTFVDLRTKCFWWLCPRKTNVPGINVVIENPLLGASVPIAQPPPQ